MSQFSGFSKEREKSNKTFYACRNSTQVGNTSSKNKRRSQRQSLETLRACGKCTQTRTDPRTDVCADPLSGFWLRYCDYLPAQEASERRPPIQTAELTIAREEHGWSKPPLTWQREQTVLSGPLAFKYKLPHALIQICQNISGS